MVPEMVHSRSEVTWSLGVAFIPDSIFHQILVEAAEDSEKKEERLEPHPHFS